MRNLILFTLMVVLHACSPAPKQHKPAGAPVINGPSIIGIYPETPFLFAIPTSGIRPMTWTAADLPGGLSLDPSSGIIRGIAPPEGTYRVGGLCRKQTGKNIGHHYHCIRYQTCPYPSDGMEQLEHLFHRSIRLPHQTDRRLYGFFRVKGPGIPLYQYR